MSWFFKYANNLEYCLEENCLSFCSSAISLSVPALIVLIDRACTKSKINILFVKSTRFYLPDKITTNINNVNDIIGCIVIGYESEECYQK